MSLLKTGLLQLSPESVVIGEVTCYDRSPAVVDRVDRESVAEALGPTSKVIIIINLLLKTELFFHSKASRTGYVVLRKNYTPTDW